MAMLGALRTDPMKFLRNVLRANAAFSIQFALRPRCPFSSRSTC